MNEYRIETYLNYINTIKTQFQYVKKFYPNFLTNPKFKTKKYVQK